jgi:flavin reductase (DIM6/NTAB) family NADH-FMN oxidoreductase RutF
MSLSSEYLARASALSAPLQQHSFTDKGSITDAFKKAMRRLTSTVTLIATEHEGVPFGMAATAVTSVCTDPSSILVCINHGASMYWPLIDHGRFSVNLLRVGQEDLVKVFGGAVNGPARFETADWEHSNGLPFLRSSQASLFCTVAQRMSYGTHEIIIGQVDDVVVAEAITPLLWQDGKPTGSVPALS